MFPYQWIEAAAERVEPYIVRTPLTYDPQEQLYIKWENHQVTGSFKPRGAINKVLTLQPWEHERGLVAASAGNHGQGVALAGKLVEARVLIFASEHAVPAKIQAMKDLGAEVRLVTGGYGEAEKAALEHCAAHDLTWVSPYNDGQVIAGQGTIALEILSELNEIHGAAASLSSQTWVLPAGGGGLIAGIGIALKEGPLPPGSNPPRVTGAQSDASPFLHHLFYTGSQQAAVEFPSLADGLSGPVEHGSLTIALSKRYADQFVLVSEAEIRQAIRFAWERYSERIEGSAAVSLAAVLTGRVAERPAVLVITGGNIQPEIHQRILAGGS